ncbi:7490_t:CDS:2, partial [Racocetra persica]
ATTDNFGTKVSLYMCIPVLDNRTFYGYVLPNTVFTVLSIPMLSTLIPRLIVINQGSPVTQYILAFSTALLGVLLFLIFGTNRRAAVFLPCCYYTPPTLPLQTMPRSFSSSNDSEQDNHVLQTFDPITVNLSENISQTDTTKSKSKAYFSHLPNIFGYG